MLTQSYADRISHRLSTLRFLIGGRRIFKDKTMRKLNLGEDSFIEVMQHMGGDHLNNKLEQLRTQSLGTQSIFMFHGAPEESIYSGKTSNWNT